jgi:hypothetical protein
MALPNSSGKSDETEEPGKNDRRIPEIPGFFDSLFCFCWVLQIIIVLAA